MEAHYPLSCAQLAAWEEKGKGDGEMFDALATTDPLDADAAPPSKGSNPSGEVARAASHCAAWRLCTTDHLLVLEDGVEAPPDLADAVALLLSEVPEDYDLLYLSVPERYRVDEKGDGRGVRASVPALSAYVASKAACAKLLDLCRAGLDRPLGEGRSIDTVNKHEATADSFRGCMENFEKGRMMEANEFKNFSAGKDQS